MSARSGCLSKHQVRVEAQQQRTVSLVTVTRFAWPSRQNRQRWGPHCTRSYLPHAYWRGGRQPPNGRTGSGCQGLWAP